MSNKVSIIISLIVGAILGFFLGLFFIWIIIKKKIESLLKKEGSFDNIFDKDKIDQEKMSEVFEVFKEKMGGMNPNISDFLPFISGKKTEKDKKDKKK